MWLFCRPGDWVILSERALPTREEAPEDDIKRNSIEARRKRYFEVNSELAQIDDRRLSAMFEAAELSQGWGRNHTLSVGRHKVFVKRVPLTEIEVESPFSTKNLYGIPTFYNYGVGSAGFGAFRELVANIKTTNWVLDGQIETFPLLYHYRIVHAPREASPIDRERHERYVEYWGGDLKIGRYIEERARAQHELVLMLEHIPDVLDPWLKERPQRAPRIFEQLAATFEFLRQRGVIHFDAHYHNVVVDEDRPYLTDFGLVLDRAFDLSAEEQAFFRRHTFYDFGEGLAYTYYIAERACDALAEEDKARLASILGLREGISNMERLGLLISNVEAVRSAGLLKLDRGYLDSVIRYRPVILLMGEFFTTLRNNSRKDTPFPHVELRKRLRGCGIGG